MRSPSEKLAGLFADDLAMSAIEMQEAALAARIEVKAHSVADLDRRSAKYEGIRGHRGFSQNT